MYNTVIYFMEGMAEEEEQRFDGEKSCREFVAKQQRMAKKQKLHGSYLLCIDGCRFGGIEYGKF